MRTRQCTRAFGLRLIVHQMGVTEGLVRRRIELADIPGAPGRAPQFSLSRASGGELLGGDGDLVL